MFFFGLSSEKRFIQQIIRYPPIEEPGPVLRGSLQSCSQISPLFFLLAPPPHNSLM